MKQLEVGDPREDHLCTAKDDEGTALDSRAKLKWWSPTSVVHLGGCVFHRDDLRKVRAR
jgi:hypothetical protein